MRVRLPNSIAAWNAEWWVPTGTKLSGVHLGHSEQPSPDSVTRTVAPVTAIPELTMTLPNAHQRREAVVGCQIVRANSASTTMPTAQNATCQAHSGRLRIVKSSAASATDQGEAVIRQIVVEG